MTNSLTTRSAELADLLESQLISLEKETFGCATEAELREYEDRRDRIGHLYADSLTEKPPRSFLAAAWRSSRNDLLLIVALCCSVVGGQKCAESPPQGLSTATAQTLLGSLTVAKSSISPTNQVNERNRLP